MQVLSPSGRLAGFAIVAVLTAACTVQLVAPYNAELQQKASSMQAAVAAWDLTMRRQVGTVAADPRHPDVAGTIANWRGEADAMLTLAASNDPGNANCSAAVKAVVGAIENDVPPNLRAAVATSAEAGSGNQATASSGCETALVVKIGTDLDNIEKSVKRCQMPWVPDAYFTALAADPAAAPTPPGAPDAEAQRKLENSCLAEFKVVPGAPENTLEARHGRAVSALLTTLQSIVYVETRKKAVEAAK
jgi:hypothetical protein